jgi:outer membrane biosynthesis protein TonB
MTALTPRRPYRSIAASPLPRLHRSCPIALAVIALSIAATAFSQATPTTALTLGLDDPEFAGVVGEIVEGTVVEVPAERGTISLGASTSGGSLVVELDGEVVAIVDAQDVTAVGVAAAAGDDAEEFLGPSLRDALRWPAGFTFVSSSDLELGYDPSHAEQLVGIRFTGLGVPAGARIAFAQVIFTADGGSDGLLHLTIEAERAPAAAGFAEDETAVPSESLSSRDRTSASLRWTLDEPWRGDERYATPDLSAIVQEVVDLPGWGEDGSLVLLFAAEEPGTTYRRAVSTAVGDADRAPQLRLDFALPNGARAPIEVTIDVPMGSSELTVRAFPGTRGRGEPIAATTVTLERSAETAGQPAPAHELEPVAEPVAEPGPIAEPVAEPGPIAEATDEPEPTAEATDEPEPTAEATDEPEPTAEATDEPSAVAIAEPDPIAEPEPATEDPEPVATGAAEPAAHATSAAKGPARSATATRIDQFPIRAIRTVIVVGELELVSYDNATSAITWSWRRPRTTSLTASVQSGNCVLPGAALVDLRPLEAPETAITTPLPLSGSALRFGGFVVVVRDGDGTPVGCTELGR